MKNLSSNIYASYRNVDLVQETTASLGGTDECMESPSCDIGDLGVIVESMDVGLSSSVIHSLT